MPKFLVSVREVHTNTVVVEAATADEARQIGHGGCVCGTVEYSHTMDFENTTAQPAPDYAKVDLTSPPAADIDPDDQVEHGERWDGEDWTGTATC